MSRAAMYTHEEHERAQLGFRPSLVDGVLRVQVTSAHGCVRLTKANVDALKLHVRDALHADARAMVVNLRDCLDIDGYAMGVLYSMAKTFATRDGILIEDADPDLRALFVAHDVAQWFTFAPSEGTP